MRVVEDGHVGHSPTLVRRRGAPLIGSQAQTRGTEQPDHLTRWCRNRTGLDHLCVVLGRDVVVVAVESLARDPLCGGEGMQLLEALVADEVRPDPSVGLPHGFVDAHRHPTITPRAALPTADRGQGGRPDSRWVTQA